MKKNNKKKIIKGIGTTTILTSVIGITPVFASGIINWDEVYKNAYNSMKVVEVQKTQQSINDARKYINELAKNESLINMASTLSTRVDGIQENLFQQFYSLMYVNGKKKTRMSQSEINRAREYVNDFSTYEGNKKYTESWSSAIDEFQQKNINETILAIETLEKGKAIEDLKPAKQLLNELKTSTNEDTKNLVKNLDKRITLAEKEVLNKIEKEKEEQLEAKVKEHIKELERNIDSKIDEFKREQQKIIDNKTKEAEEKINKEIEKLNKEIENSKKQVEQKMNSIKGLISQVENPDVQKQLIEILKGLSQVVNDNFKKLS
ncbi:hypothetical protein C3495_11785 [Clostridiaceae bacterium 14S0207]|nr:hypothetical protein C3495_11785 [Clostridiaceae bacterium 14S0207]